MKTMKINAISHKSYGRAARKENPVWVESEDDAESLSACSLGACPVVPQERQENPLPEASQVIQEMPFEAYKQGLYMDLQDLKIPVSSAKEEAIRQGYLDGVPSPQMLRQLLQLGPRLPAVRGPPPRPRLARSPREAGACLISTILFFGPSGKIWMGHLNRRILFLGPLGKGPSRSARGARLRARRVFVLDNGRRRRGRCGRRRRRRRRGRRRRRRRGRRRRRRGRRWERRPRGGRRRVGRRGPSGHACEV